MKNLLNSCRKTLSQLSKMFLRVQATFSCFFFVKSVQILFVLFIFWLIQLQFWQIFVRQGLQNCTLRARGSFWGKTIGVRFFFNSSTVSGFEQKFSVFGANCVPALSKVHIFRQRNKLRKLLFWKNVYTFNNFRPSGWIFPGPQWQFLKVPSNFKLLCSKQHFGLKYIFQARSSSYRFWTLSKTYSDFWLGIFAHYFHNCNYVSIATSSLKTFFLKS